MDAKSMIGSRTLSKIKWRLLPFAVFLYVIGMMDRMNLGFAALEMNKDLHITSQAFGMLAAVFFTSYLIFEVPSNIAMHRYGAKLWIARIMVSWGIVTSLMFFAQEYFHIGGLRFLLGIMEAGFFPGMIYYFTYWFPSYERGAVVGIFMMGIPLSTFISAPLSTWIMDNIHWMNYAGWRWMFMIEGLLAVVVGIITYFYMTNRPEDAKWLSNEEKEWLAGEMAKESKAKAESAKMSLGQIFTYGKIWRLAAIYFVAQIMSQTVSTWMPQIIKGFSQNFSNTNVGMIIALPAIIAMFVMPLWGRHSDKTRERKYHTAIMIMLAGIGLVIAASSTNIILQIIGVTMAYVASVCYTGPFWAMPTMFLTAQAAAVGVAIINSCSSLGGFIGNLTVGYIKGSAWGSSGVLLFQSACCVIAFLLVVTLPVKKTASAAELDQSASGKS